MQNNFKGVNVTKGRTENCFTHTHTQKKLFHHSNRFREVKTFQHLLVDLKQRRYQFEHFISNQINQSLRCSQFENDRTLKKKIFLSFIMKLFFTFAMKQTRSFFFRKDSYHDKKLYLTNG